MVGVHGQCTELQKHLPQEIGLAWGEGLNAFSGTALTSVSAEGQGGQGCPAPFGVHSLDRPDLSSISDLLRKQSPSMNFTVPPSGPGASPSL